ncbi:TetR/AcrR family transcriptional regulator [Paramicrobacterium agarici]|uniref:TetR/AcrR family transcriptional regulator n=1 Tax=Paramicrobacterium agarici TaxID=630514 RepID=UPI0011666612|nr:TetR/AcrR family transcriptional regulator [Microbacterium agarici]TQO21598.1 TetR family transcriptional regulator [Microbacterium agarici]
MAKPLRADAKRNRDNLVAVARRAFATDGNASLEGIAREAGVGIGTLYRHFATREALVESVYAAELDEVAASADDLLQRFPAEKALEAWVRRYAEFVMAKRGIIETLRSGWAAGRIATPSTRQRITAAIDTILSAGVREGTLRGDVAADDVTALLLGVCLATPTDDDAPQRSRMLDLVIGTLRVHA